MKNRCLLIILLGFHSVCWSEPELKGSPEALRGFLHPADNIVTIKGQAEEKAYSDKAVVNLVVTTEGKLLSEAISSNRVIRDKISAELVKLGLSSDSIKSSKFSSTPEYGWFGSKPERFTVVNRLAVTISKERSFEQIAVLADANEQVDITGTTFEHSQKEAFYKKVKAMALEEIIDQKEIYERVLGVTLIASGIRETKILQGPTEGALMLEQAVSPPKKREKTLSSAPKYDHSAQPATFDEIKYQSILSVDFKFKN